MNTINTLETIPEPKVYEFPNSDFIFELGLNNVADGGTDWWDRLSGTFRGTYIEIVMDYECNWYQVLVGKDYGMLSPKSKIVRMIYKIAQGDIR